MKRDQAIEEISKPAIKEWIYGLSSYFRTVPWEDHRDVGNEILWKVQLSLQEDWEIKDELKYQVLWKDQVFRVFLQI